jgi:D-threonine aldolase
LAACQAGGVHVSDLSTPALVIDAAQFDHNLATMAAFLPGARLRPHVKAHKSTAIAAAQVGVGHHTFTCATPREVVGMAHAGVGTDLLLANETIDATRLRAMAELDVAVTVAVDSDETIRAAAAAGISACLIDVNVGLRRCGIAPDEAGRLADRARAAGLDVRGVMGYEGHLMMVADRPERLESVERSMALLLAASADVGGEIISAGGTGTYDLHENTGVNEIQAGSYALMDTHYGQQGLPFGQALFVIGTVISVSAGWAVADVGLKALGMDHGNPSVVGGTVWFCSDEHLTFEPDEPMTVGDRIRVIPAHVDPTMAMHASALLIRDDEVIDAWPINLRGW